MTARVTDAPAVVRHQQTRMKEVAHGAVHRSTLREAAVAAVMAKDEDCPEHSALRKYVERQACPPPS